MSEQNAVSETVAQELSEQQAPEMVAMPTEPAQEQVAQEPQEQPAQEAQQETKSEDAESTDPLGLYTKDGSAEPVAYEFKTAEGEVVNDDNTQIVSSLARELKLSNEQAQKLWEMGLGEKGAVAQINQRAILNLNHQWAEEIKQDAQLGGSNLTTTRHNVGRAISYADDELKTFLQQSGLGNFPPLVRYLNRIGKQLGSDMSFVGGKPTAAPKAEDWLSKLYNNSPDLR